MYRVKKWFETFFSCVKQDEGQFSGELVCSYPTLIIPGNVLIPSSDSPPAPAGGFPAPNAIPVEEKGKNERDFLDLILRTDDIPSSKSSPVDIDTDDHSRCSGISMINEEEEYEAPSFRQFVLKKEPGKHQQEAQILNQEDGGFSFWPEEESVQLDVEEHEEEQDGEESASFYDIWINQESENQTGKEGDDDQIPAEQILEEIFENQIKPMRLSYNGKSTSRSILMDPSVDFSAGFSSVSSSSSSASSHRNRKKKLIFRLEDCCLPHQIRKTEILISKLGFKNRILKLVSGLAHDNARMENRSNSKAALKTFFCSSLKSK